MSDMDRLVREATQGDSVAVDALIERFLPEIQVFIRLKAGALLLGKESSSDLAQSVCREVLERIDEFRHGGTEGFRKWLYRTALRKIADRYEYYRAARRDVNREREPVVRDSPSAAVVTAYRTMLTPSHAAMAREELDRFEVAFAALSSEQQDVVLLSRFVGLPHAEIAAHVGKSEVAVRSILSRALSRIAERMDEQA